MFNKAIIQTKTLIQIINTVKNWNIYIGDYLKLINKEYLIILLRNGIKYKVRSKTDDRGVISEIWICNCYNPDGFEIKDKDIVVDIGAHIGIFSVFASKYAKNGKIYAIEPIKENFDILKENVKINKIKNIVSINQAVSDKDAEKDIYIDHNTAGNSFLIKGNKKIKIKTTSLNTIIKKHNIKKIDFLKMDCEGAEYEILFNLPQSIFDTINKISMEYHNIDKLRNVDAIKKLLIKKGFKVKVVKTPLIIGMLYAEK